MKIYGNLVTFCKSVLLGNLVFCDHLKTYENPKRITNQFCTFCWSSLHTFLKIFWNLFCKPPSKNLRKSIHVLSFLMVKTILLNFRFVCFWSMHLQATFWIWCVPQFEAFHFQFTTNFILCVIFHIYNWLRHALYLLLGSVFFCQFF